MEPSSLDLRQKILRADDQPLGSPRALTALRGVSHSVLETLLPRRWTAGACAPRPHAGGRQPRRDAAALAVGRQMVQVQPEATLEELWTQLPQQRGRRARIATMCRLLPRLGRPRKQRPSMRLNGKPRASSRPARPPAP
jgi:transposase